MERQTNIHTYIQKYTLFGNFKKPDAQCAYSLKNDWLQYSPFITSHKRGIFSVAPHKFSRGKTKNYVWHGELPRVEKGFPTPRNCHMWQSQTLPRVANIKSNATCSHSWWWNTLYSLFWSLFTLYYKLTIRYGRCTLPTVSPKDWFSAD